MKILIANDNGLAHYFIRLGLARAFTYCGHEVIMWNINQKSTFDAFDECNPDLFIGQTYNVDSAIYTCIKERPDMKVIMKAGDWGPLQKEIDLKEFPVLVASQHEKETILSLKRETGKPDFVDIHYHPNRVEQTHGYWKENGIKIVGLMSGADIFDYTNGKIHEEFKSDITFVGGYWGYKSKTLNPWLVRLCGYKRNYNIKIFGNQPWSVPQYCGYISDDLVKHVLASAKICPNISEHHSQVFGYDIVERPWKLMSNKCFVISDYVDSMAKDVFTNDELVFAHNPDEFEELIQHYINHPLEGVPYAERGYNTVINNHTYFHRIKQIFTELDMIEEAKHVDLKYEELKGVLGL